MRHESYKEDEDFFFNNDFSDQIFLVKKEELLRKIYKFKHIYSLRFPLAHIGSIFEKRVDSYIKKNNKTRLIYKKAIYIHPKSSGSPYPKSSILKNIEHYFYMLIIIIYYYCFHFFRDKWKRMKVIDFFKIFAINKFKQ